MENLLIDSPLSGTLIELCEVNDKIFSSGAAGRGAAIKNPDGKIFAPFAGTVEFFASPGVIGLKSFSGVELLIHVGLNTCKLIGESFQQQVATGDTVRRGQILLTKHQRLVNELSEESLQAVVDQLNKRVRKCLGYKTPWELWFSQPLHLA